MSSGRSLSKVFVMLIFFKVSSSSSSGIISTVIWITLAERGAKEAILGAAASCHYAPCFAPTLDQLNHSKRSRGAEAPDGHVHAIFQCPAIFFNGRKRWMVGRICLITHGDVICTPDMRQQGRPSRRKHLPFQVLWPKEFPSECWYSCRTWRPVYVADETLQRFEF